MTFDLKLQKRLAARALKGSHTRVRFDPARLNDIKAAITTQDVIGLIAQGAISEVPKRGISRVRARKIAVQKSKGLRKGPGSRKGKINAGRPAKTAWIAKIRAQREFILGMRERKEIDHALYRELYGKSKGGFFRSVRHIKIYLSERGVRK